MTSEPRVMDSIVHSVYQHVLLKLIGYCKHVVLFDCTELSISDQYSSICVVNSKERFRLWIIERWMYFMYIGN